MNLYRGVSDEEWEALENWRTGVLAAEEKKKVEERMARLKMVQVVRRAKEAAEKKAMASTKRSSLPPLKAAPSAPLAPQRPRTAQKPRKRPRTAQRRMKKRAEEMERRVEEMERMAEEMKRRAENAEEMLRHAREETRTGDCARALAAAQRRQMVARMEERRKAEEKATIDLTKIMMEKRKKKQVHALKQRLAKAEKEKNADASRLERLLRAMEGKFGIEPGAAAREAPAPPPVGNAAGAARPRGVVTPPAAEGGPSGAPAPIELTPSRRRPRARRRWPGLREWARGAVDGAVTNILRTGLPAARRPSLVTNAPAIGQVIRRLGVGSVTAAEAAQNLLRGNDVLSEDRPRECVVCQRKKGRRRFSSAMWAAAPPDRWCRDCEALGARGRVRHEAERATPYRGQAAAATVGENFERKMKIADTLAKEKEEEAKKLQGGEKKEAKNAAAKAKKAAARHAREAVRWFITARGEEGDTAFAAQRGKKGLRRMALLGVPEARRACRW